MIARLSIETRAAMFEDCLKQLEEVITFFYDILTYKLSPFDWRNYEGDWDYRDIDNFSLPYDDKDAPFIGQLYHELQVIYEKLKARNEKVQADADANDLARRRFEVWQYGLCPYAIEECRKQVMKNLREAMNKHEITAVRETRSNPAMNPATKTAQAKPTPTITQGISSTLKTSAA